MTVEAVLRPGKSRDAKYERRRREFLFVAQGGKCCLCDGVMNLSHPRSPGYASFEHLVPRRSTHNGQSQARKIRKAALILLSHRLCNNQRDVAPVSSALIEHAHALWRQFREAEAAFAAENAARGRERLKAASTPSDGPSTEEAAPTAAADAESRK